MGTPLYDTNILLGFLRDGVPRIEGSTTSLNLIEFPRAAGIDGLKVIIPGKEDFDEAFEIAVSLLKAGTPVPAVDIVIAAVALNRNLVISTTDRHFKAIQQINTDLQVDFV